MKELRALIREVVREELDLVAALSAVPVPEGVLDGKRVIRIAPAAPYSCEGCAFDAYGPCRSRRPQEIAAFGMTCLGLDKAHRPVGDECIYVETP